MSGTVLEDAVTCLLALITILISYLIFGPSQNHCCFLAPSTDPRGDLREVVPSKDYIGHASFFLLKPTSLRKQKTRIQGVRTRTSKTPYVPESFFFVVS